MADDAFDIDEIYDRELYPESRLPGPAVMLFEIQFDLECKEEAQKKAFETDTLRVSPYAFLPDTVDVKRNKR